MKKHLFVFAFCCLMASCTPKNPKSVEQKKETPKSYLPFRTLALSELENFKGLPANWRQAAGVFLDDGSASFQTQDGQGVLVNQPQEGSGGHLITQEEFGDVEVRLLVMLPREGNSGIYLQGRYEVQVFDSWSTQLPTHADMGGIYERWDESREEGQKGYEGHAPLLNAAKAPGLWQELRILFKAPRFDVQGNKTSDAFFKEVWVNGVLVQENVTVTGPTRSAPLQGEQAKGPLVIQGDHGPVAIKEIAVKPYGHPPLQIKDVVLTEYASDSVHVADLSQKPVERQEAVDTISAAMVSGNRSSKVLSFNGTLEVPTPGTYLFDYRINEGGGILVVGQDTVVDLNGDYPLDSLGIGTVSLEQGKIPFELVYNKHRSWRQGFSLHVEGPGLERHAIHAPGSMANTAYRPEDLIGLSVEDGVVLQRCFWMHGQQKRTHAIAVGLPAGIHFAYDLSKGAPLQMWSGDFLDVTDMWRNRGEKQLGRPKGATVTHHGFPNFLTTLDTNALPSGSGEEALPLIPNGYSLDGQEIPRFEYSLGNTAITDALKPGSGPRSLQRTITISGDVPVYHLLASGEDIQVLPNGRFIINNESYFVQMETGSTLMPAVRQFPGGEALFLEVPEGSHTISYSLIW